jgi:hypothetical protein
MVRSHHVLDELVIDKRMKWLGLEVFEGAQDLAAL